MIDKNYEGDFSTKVGDNSNGPVAGGINSKAIVNEKDYSPLIKTIVIAVIILIGFIILTKLGVINSNNLPEMAKPLLNFIK